MPKQQEVAPRPKGAARVQVVDHKAKVPFWKPRAVNERIIGKLVRVVSRQDGGKSMRLSTAQGPISVGINFALADVPWEEHVGRIVELIFTGEIGQRHGRTYDAFVTESDEVPF